MTDDINAINDARKVRDFCFAAAGRHGINFSACFFKCCIVVGASYENPDVQILLPFSSQGMLFSCSPKLQMKFRDWRGVQESRQEFSNADFFGKIDVDPAEDEPRSFNFQTV